MAVAVGGSSSSTSFSCAAKWARAAARGSTAVTVGMAVSFPLAIAALILARALLLIRYAPFAAGVGLAVFFFLGGGGCGVNSCGVTNVCL